MKKTLKIQKYFKTKKKNYEETCEKIIKIKKVFEPDIEQVKLYKEKYEQFKNIYPAVKSLF